jgi:amino acid transporter
MEGGPAQSCLDGKLSMTRRRGLILSIVTAGCWIILLAIVLNSVFAASNLAKQIRSKDRQSAQGVDDIASTPFAVRNANLTRLIRSSGLDLVANSVETIQDSRCHKMSFARQNC